MLDRDDLVAGDDVFFSATGITDGDVLQGVRYPSAGGATTESLVMRSRSGTVRRIRATHDRAKLRAVGGDRFSGDARGMSPQRLGCCRPRCAGGAQRLALIVKKVNSAISATRLRRVRRSAPHPFRAPRLRHGDHSNVVIGRRVTIYQNVTIAVRAATGSPHRIVIGDDVTIGANSVVISPNEGSLHIGRGARIGAGAVVVKDVPAGATVISAPARVLLDADGESEDQVAESEERIVSGEEREGEQPTVDRDRDQRRSESRPTRDSARSRLASDRRKPWVTMTWIGDWVAS